MINKKTWLRVLVIVFGMTVIWNLEAQTDSRLNGSWVQNTEGVEFELRLRNGNFEELYNNISFRKGTFTTTPRELTIIPTHMHGAGLNFLIESVAGIDFGLESKWYSINEAIITIRAALLKLGASEKEANEFVETALSTNDTKSTYSVDGKTLILVSSMLGQSFTVILTKK